VERKEIRQVVVTVVLLKTAQSQSTISSIKSDESSAKSDSTKDVKTADNDFQSKILGIAKGKVSDKNFDKLKKALENHEHRKLIKDGFAKAEKYKRKRHNGSRIDI
jgi:hypothetical protein